MRIFIVGAIVLVVFAIIAGAQASGTWWVTTWYVWAAASLLSFYVDTLLGWSWAVGPFATRQRPPA